MNWAIMFRLMLVASFLTAVGCTPLLFTAQQGGCTEIRGRAGTQAILLDSTRVGEMRTTGHHGGPPDMVPLILGPELNAIGVSQIQLRAAGGDSVYSACAGHDEDLRMCFLRSRQLSAAGTELFFSAKTTAADWQILRDVQKYWDLIAACDPNAGN